MNKEDRELLRHISKTLDEVLVVLKTPANKFIRAIEVAGAIISIFAVIGIRLVREPGWFSNKSYKISV